MLIGKHLGYLADWGRLKISIITTSVPIIGGSVAYQDIDFFTSFHLGVIGFCAHFFGFGLNDVIDHKLDSTLDYTRNPIAKGKIPLWEAWFLLTAFMLIAIGIYYYVLQGTILGLSILISSVLFSFVYNEWSKWGRVPRCIAEVSLAISVGLLFIAGATLYTFKVSFQAVLFAGTLSLILLLLNSVCSGLKDINTDSKFGVTSFVLSAGAHMTDDEHFKISKFLLVYSLSLQIIITFFLLMQIYFLEINLAVSLIILVLVIYSNLHLRLILSMNSVSSLQRLNPTLNGWYNYAALLLSHKTSAYG